MKLVIGGFAQGKRNYVLERNGPRDCMVLDGKLRQDEEPDEEPDGEILVVDHLHRWIRGCLENGGCPEEEIRTFVKDHPDCILISDEIGNGIVPADSFEREYRERTGRILTELAGSAEEVVRVICGIGQRIK